MNNRIDPRTGKRRDWVDPNADKIAAKARDKAIAQELALLERQAFALKAREDFMTFVKFTMPDPEDLNDVHRSKYKAAKHHVGIANAVEQVESGDIRFLILVCPPRHGKACGHDTPVLTTQGWRLHGELQVGDEVFGPDGLPTKIVGVSDDVTEVVPVTLSNGEVIRCHPNHEWTVYDRGPRRWKTMETHHIARRALHVGPVGTRGGRHVIQLPDTSALQFPDAELPLHPYVLGAWLGDGSEGSTRIAHDVADTEVVSAIEALGHVVSWRYVQPGTGVGYVTFAGTPGRGSPMQLALKKLGVLRGKCVPEMYLRSSIAQRLELLAGLVDTDGHVEKDTGRVRFSTCSEALRDGVFDLASTLGFKPYIVVVQPTTSSSGIVGKQVVYQVGFQPNLVIPTRIPRKRVAKVSARRRVAIAAVGAAEKASAKCIQVERSDGLYLVGRTLQPTHNSELVSRRLPAWFIGRHPDQNVVVATYNDDFASDFGKDVRGIMATPQYRQAFPDVKLQRGGAASDRLQTVKGGQLSFVGRRGSLTGRGAHLMILDDLIKDDNEARSQAIRDEAWNFVVKVAMTRRMGKKLVIMTFTRWNSDDPIGRLTDPENPHYRLELAKKIKIIHLPAIAGEDDPVGRKPGEALWPDGPDQFDLDFLHEQQLLDPLGFEALYQGQPSLLDGDLFKRENIRFYKSSDLPDELRYYCASDHAVSTSQRNDPTVLLKVGVDQYNNIYLIDCFWQRVKSDVAVEAMLAMASGNQAPLIWWAESGHISKSIGTFLYKRMTETETFINIREVTPSKDKATRAQSMVARVGMGKVWFPVDSTWTEKAIAEMMMFSGDGSGHDDFVDALAYIGLGLQSQFGASVPTPKKAEPKFGTLNWVKQNDKWHKAKIDAAAAGGF